MSEAPRFAVVGRVNKGKSSVIATLAEDDGVAISPIPGTTRRCAEHEVRVDGELQFVLVDTPGFEDAPRALAWLKQTSPPADQRRARVEAFVARHAGTDAFVEERELLAPILSGALILYVVDGTRPYRENYASEMEILRWTGQPSMALINRIGDGDHTDSWRSALDQYFKVVRDFDAHSATFDERIRLLTTFRELAPGSEASLQTAIDALTQDRERRRHEVAELIAELIADALTFTLETHEADGDKPALEDAFHKELRAKEQRARRAVERRYHHQKVSWEHAAELQRPVFGEDLFARRTWTDLGLSAGQVLALYTVSGAVAGSVVDAGLGGASFLAGTAVGSALGAGAGAVHLQRRFARATSVGGLADRAERAFRGGKRYRVGPLQHPNFPFVLLDRALLHHDAVRTRAHAKNAAAEGSTVLADAPEQRAAHLSKADRQRLARTFDRIRKGRADAAELTPLVLPLV